MHRRRRDGDAQPLNGKDNGKDNASTAREREEPGAVTGAVRRVLDADAALFEQLCEDTEALNKVFNYLTRSCSGLSPYSSLQPATQKEPLAALIKRLRLIPISHAQRPAALAVARYARV